MSRVPSAKRAGTRSSVGLQHIRAEVPFQLWWAQEDVPTLRGSLGLLGSVGWAEAVALPTEECGFRSEVGKTKPLPTLRWNGIRLHFSLSYYVPPACFFGALDPPLPLLPLIAASGACRAIFSSILNRACAVIFRDSASAISSSDKWILPQAGQLTLTQLPVSLFRISSTVI